MLHVFSSEDEEIIPFVKLYSKYLIMHILKVYTINGPICRNYTHFHSLCTIAAGVSHLEMVHWRSEGDWWRSFI